MSDLLIKINADAKNAAKAFDDIKSQTEDLENQLSKVALVSAAAFAALTAEIYISTKAFEEAREASVKLTNALQNQGIYTEKLEAQYKDYADTVQAATGIDNDALIQSQAIAQSYLGQTEITLELTQAIADLSETMGGDLNGAAEKIARTIGTGTNAFAKQGLVIAEGATEAERYATVLDFVRTKAGGLAAEMDKADGFSRRLSTSFGNFQEAIGERFAPIIAAARLAISRLFDFLAENEVITDLIVSFIAAGAAVSGIIAAVAAAVPIFTALSAAAATLGVAMNVAFLGIPVLIGAVIAGVTFLALNWEKSMAAIQAAGAAMVTFVSELFSGFGKVLTGAFNLDPAAIKAGLAQITESFKKAKDDAVKTYEEGTASLKTETQKQDDEKAKAAEEAARKEKEHQARLLAIRKNSLELLKLQNENASQQLIELKQKEIETIKAIDEQRSAEEVALLTQRLSTIRSLQELANEEEIERRQIFAAQQAEVQAELDAQGISVEAEISEKRLAEIRATAQTEADIDRKLQEDLLTSRIKARNEELLNRKKYGEAYAVINKFLQSEEVQGAKSAAGELVQLQQSKNETLKGIGKAAAITQIGIATAESAMNIYRGFSTIPIVGPALGVAGAIAAIAFGKEKIETVQAAADGGLVQGGIPGIDSVPFLLEPGELVVPKRNFNDVVGAVRGENAGSDPEVLEQLRQINEKFSNPQNNYFQGDVISDDAFVDAFIRRISDAVEFRNAQIFGVT